MRLAAAAKCQPAYFSRILSGDADLNGEQAHAMCTFFGFNDEEAQFFILLVHHGRAGTPGLKKHYQRQLKEILDRRFILKERFKVPMELSEESQGRYYSSWLFAAVHLCLSLERLQSRAEIARYLSVPEARITEVLEFLSQTGLAETHAHGYRMGKSRIHVGADSDWVKQHHINWRLQGMRTLDRAQESPRRSDLHYSAVVSLSRADQVRLKEELLETIDRFNQRVAESPAQEVHCLTLDFFGVGSHSVSLTSRTRSEGDMRPLKRLISGTTAHSSGVSRSRSELRRE